MIKILLIGLLITKKCPHLSQCAIILLVMTYIILLSEISKIYSDQSSRTPLRYFMMGILCQTCCLFLLISRIRRILILLIMTIMQIYFWVWTMGYLNSTSSLKSVLIYIPCFYLKIIPYYCYVGE